MVNAAPVHLARAVEDLDALATLPGFRDIVTGVHPPEAFATALAPADGIKECLEFSTLRQ